MGTAWHSRGTAWARHGMCELALIDTIRCAGYIYWTICKHIGLQVSDKYMTERVLNVNGTTIIWDVPVFTYQITLANRPVVVLQDEKDKTCLLIDIAITNDSQVNTKENEKLSKYADLEIEGSRMWKVRTNIEPVITGTLGKIKKGLDQLFLLLSSHPPSIELQKMTPMCSAIITRKMLRYIA
jgi:hypothetical protein